MSKKAQSCSSGSFLTISRSVILSPALTCFLALTCFEAESASFVKELNHQIQQKTGINPAKPIPKISVDDINSEIKKKFGVDPKYPAGKNGNDWLFKGWKPLREPLLPSERIVDKAISAAAEGKKWAVLFLDSLLLNRHWPDGFPAQPQKPLGSPSVELTLERQTIDDAMSLYKGEVIPLAAGDFVEIGDVRITLDSVKNVFAFDIAGGKFVYRFLRENSFHVNRATFQAIPVIAEQDGKTLLGFKTRCTYLDIADCPEEIDRFAAHAITDGLESRNDGIIATLNLSALLGQPIKLKTRSQTVGVPHLKDATVFARGDAVVAQVAFDVAKQSKESVQ